jgi:hypothetical protein
MAEIPAEVIEKDRVLTEKSEGTKEALAVGKHRHEFLESNPDCTQAEYAKACRITKQAIQKSIARYRKSIDNPVVEETSDPSPLGEAEEAREKEQHPAVKLHFSVEVKQAITYARSLIDAAEDLDCDEREPLVADSREAGRAWTEAAELLERLTVQGDDDS